MVLREREYIRVIKQGAHCPEKFLTRYSYQLDFMLLVGTMYVEQVIEAD